MNKRNMTARIFKNKELRIYQTAIGVALRIFKLLKMFPVYENFPFPVKFAVIPVLIVGILSMG